jgi:lipopolysaccharide export system permease protein
MIFDRYLFRSLGLATLFTALTLATIILLTQSLKFLELVINSGASSGVFWLLTILALPRFFEVILPLALMIATVFVYNRMTSDSEIVVMRAAGHSPLRLARPAIVLSMIVTVILLAITSWLAPVSLSSMLRMKQVIKAQYSTLLFREGVFNNLGEELTVYVRKRNDDGELEGIVIYDSRPEQPQPVTIFAKRGVIVISDEGQQVLVYDGSRQVFDPLSGVLDRLNFERYSIDLPESGAVRQRWREPEERTMNELFNPDPSVERDVDNWRAFRVEAYRRFITPFLAMTFCVISLVCLLLGPMDRRGQGRRILLAVVSVITLQGLYLSTYNLAVESVWGLLAMYGLVLVPLAIGLVLLSPYGEQFRHHLLYPQRNTTPRRKSA